MDALQAIRNLTRHQWDWDFHEFCRKLGLMEASAHAQGLFEAFSQAATALRRFDDSSLLVLTGAVVPLPPAA